MRRHFVTFLSPDSLVPCMTRNPVDAWDVDAAVEAARGITHEGGAKPYRFRFSTWSRGDDDLDSSLTAISPVHWLGGKVDLIGEDRVLTIANPYRWRQRIDPEDVVLDVVICTP